MEETKKDHITTWAVTIIVFCAIILAGYFFRHKLFPNFYKNNITPEAVFLINGQAFFGVVTDDTVDTITLKNVYYLNQTQETQNDGTVKPQVGLVKLGSEIHQPQDEMLINKQQIIFREKLQDSSQISQTIKNATTK